jgi:hypothetical protein
MRRNVVLVVLILELVVAACAPGEASAVPRWYRVYGGGESRAIRMIRGTSDGGLVTVGTAGEDKLWLMKLGGTGNVAWEKSYEIQGRGTAVEEAPGGEFIAVGSTTASADFLDDLLITMVGPSGTVRWQKAYGRAGEDYAASVRRTGDGNYLIAGTTTSPGVDGYQPMLLKIDPQGEILWQRKYGSGLAGGWSMGLALETTPDGGCILAADENWLLKLDADGNPQWQKRYPHVGFGQSRIEFVSPVPGGGYVAAGYKPPPGESNMHAWVMRLDEQGNLLWQHGYRFGEDASWARGIVPAPDGDFLVGGTFYAGWSDSDAFLMRLDAGGAVRWAKAYHRDDQEELNSLQPADGGYVAAGESFSEPRSEGFILRVGPDGSVDGCRPVRETPVALVEADAVAVDAGEPWTATAAEPRALQGAALATVSRVRIACADPRTVTVIRPNGGESLPAGGERELAWRAPPEAVDFNLAYSLDRGRTWGKIAWNVPGTSHIWSLPIPADNRRRCLVKVKGFDAGGRPVGLDRSDSIFTIQVVELTQPSGQSLEGGTAFTVRWDTFGTSAPVRSAALFFSRDAGATWEKLVELAGNPGSHVWRVPQANTAEGLIRVRLKDQAGKTVGHDDFRIYLKP